MSMIHEALKKAYKDKVETLPPIPASSYVSHELSEIPKKNNRHISIFFSVLIGFCILAMAALYSAMTTERSHRQQVEMSLVQKEQIITGLQDEIVSITDEKNAIVDESTKARDEYLASTAQWKEEFSRLNESKGLLATELDAKKKVLGRLAYKVHKLEKN